jgi:hypothetical protein
MSSRRAIAAAALPLLLAAGCSASHPAAKPAHAKAAAVHRQLPPGCAADLAAVPARPPATQRQAEKLNGQLIGRNGNLAAQLTDDVGADAGQIGFAMGMGGDVAGALRAYEQDVTTLRSYCVGS